MATPRWATCAKAGYLYASIVLAVGFFFGTIRTLLIAPRLGETTAVSLEAPFMLVVSWNLSRWSARRYKMLTDTNEALLMGAIALAILTLVELGTAALLFRETALEYFSGLWSVPGAIGLAAQLCFAAFPFLQAIGRQTKSHKAP